MDWECTCVHKFHFSLAIKNDWKWLFDIEFTDCVVSENIHTSPLKDWNFLGVGWGLSKTKRFKKSMKLNWNFHRGAGVGGGVLENIPSMR